MDVLSYSAFNRQNSLKKEILEKDNCIFQIGENIKTYEAEINATSGYGFWVREVESVLCQDPSRTDLWSQIPTLSGTGFKVCNNTGDGYCSACCQWTVPGGATCARFQLWGAGAGSGSGQCCGGSPFGSTGAYASVIIPVTAGCTYTLCAGCATPCYGCCSMFTRYPGFPSFVTGPGLCNFCANGGQGGLGDWRAQQGANVFCAGSPGPNGSSCFAGSAYCWTSCWTGGLCKHVPGASYFGCTNISGCIIPVYGIRGMWPQFYMESTGNIVHKHPPIYGYEEFTKCTLNYAISQCCSGYFIGRYCCGYLQYPSAGGTPSNVCGNCCNTLADGAGRFGMVCVTYV